MCTVTEYLNNYCRERSERPNLKDDTHSTSFVSMSKKWSKKFGGGDKRGEKRGKITLEVLNQTTAFWGRIMKLIMFSL